MQGQDCRPHENRIKNSKKKKKKEVLQVLSAGLGGNKSKEQLPVELVQEMETQEEENEEEHQE